MEITPVMLIAEPLGQSIERLSDKQGRYDLTVILHSINICPQLWIAIVQELPKEFIEPVTAENVWKPASSFALLRRFHRVWPACVTLVCDLVCAKCASGVRHGVFPVGLLVSKGAFRTIIAALQSRMYWTASGFPPT